MDWAKIISEILWMEEITERQLCSCLSTSITAATLNRLKNGHTKMPLYHLGNELVQRHKRLKYQYSQSGSSLMEPQGGGHA